VSGATSACKRGSHDLSHVPFAHQKPCSFHCFLSCGPSFFACSFVFFFSRFHAFPLYVPIYHESQGRPFSQCFLFCPCAGCMQSFFSLKTLQRALPVAPSLSCFSVRNKIITPFPQGQLLFAVVSEAFCRLRGTTPPCPSLFRPRLLSIGSVSSSFPLSGPRSNYTFFKSVPPKIFRVVFCARPRGHPPVKWFASFPRSPFKPLRYFPRFAYVSLPRVFVRAGRPLSLLSLPQYLCV